MKLIRFTVADSPHPCFGVVIRDQAVPFAVLQTKTGKSSPHLAYSRSYLANLPDSEWAADAGLSSLEAAKRIEFGPYAGWRAPARLYMNVERAYREFRNEPSDASRDSPATFDAIYRVAKAKGIEVEF